MQSMLLLLKDIKFVVSNLSKSSLSLFGGWPGAKIAQSFLRHKSKKLSFRITYWLTVAANCGALYWLVTPKGSIWLKNTLNNINFG